MHIQDLANRHLGERGFVIGGGPSLIAQSLSILLGEVTFTCNRGYLLWPRIGGPSRYWSVEDVLDVQQWADEFRQLEGTIKLIADDIGELGAGSLLVPFVRERFDVAQGPRFALEPPFYWGATVSYLMIQLAVYFGCNPIYLLGHDFNYRRLPAILVKDAVARQSEALRGLDSSIWRNVGDDVDHFDPSYWPDGSRAFPADLPRMRAAFVAARTACDAIGTRIVNLTPGSKLDVFDVGELSEVLR